LGFGSHDCYVEDGSIQTAVLLVEQKYAASGVQAGTGAQKLAEVILLTEQSVTALLAKAGISVDSSYIAIRDLRCGGDLECAECCGSDCGCGLNEFW
jgi:hypothetical protein